MHKCVLSNEEINRYSRHLVLDKFNVQAQILLKNSKVLVIGCGGLGCPAAIYLCSNGIGEIGLMDDDSVELNNIHRQIGHSHFKLNINKAESLKLRCEEVNSNVKIKAIQEKFVLSNATRILSDYDAVLDCTDNLPTRYLINDACAISGRKPVISASALQVEGQISVYLSPYSSKVIKKKDDTIACYRCIYPRPPPMEAIGSCSEQGIIGVVPGIMGIMQAAEALKVLTGIGTPLSGRLLVYNWKEASTRIVELRKWNPNCPACGLNNDRFLDSDTYFSFFNGVPAHDKEPKLNTMLTPGRITVSELNVYRQTQKAHLLIDIRQNHELQICHLENTLFYNSTKILKKDVIESLSRKISKMKREHSINHEFEVILICHRGNLSHALVPDFTSAMVDMNCIVAVRDVIGGFSQWSKDIDLRFPDY